MDDVLSRSIRPIIAGALLLAGACTTGVNVGSDGVGGATPDITSAGAGAGGGGVPFGTQCNSPAALLCPWGWIGGPCGGNKPFKQDCAIGWVCVGATDDAEGTCAVPGQDVASPGDACGAGVPSTPICPWNYRCDAPLAPDGVGTCVPGTCVLDDGSPLVSAASFTVDGDGPTKHFDFACAEMWGSTQTGEANGYATASKGASGPNVLFLNGCGSPDGTHNLGSLFLQVPLTTLGTTQEGQMSYEPPSATGNFITLSDPMTVTVTVMDENLVRGSYDGIVQGAAPESTRHITGTFEVCHLPFHATE